MRILYLIKETVDGFRRAKTSNILCIISVAFLLILIGVFLLISFNIDHFGSSINSKIEIQAFISNIMEDEQITSLMRRIEKFESVEKVEYISKESAIMEFQQEFGKDLFNILDDNPLPSSLKIKLKDGYRNEEGIKQVSSQIKKEAGIEEIVDHYQSLMLLSRYARIATKINLILLLFVTVGSVLLIANAIRLVISSRKHIIETMKLVGATDFYIRTPLLLEGSIQGLLGGMIASTFLYGIMKGLASFAPGIGIFFPNVLIIILFVGFFFGLLGSILAVSKFL